jgi:thiamine phosphate synthase YjbQ (UPF0047 family)
MLLGTSVSIPIENGRLMLSDIQSILAVEFDGSRERDVVVHVTG